LKTFFIPPFSVFYFIILVHFFIIYPERHDHRAGQILKQVRLDGASGVRRMQDAISPMHMDGGRQEKNRMAMHQPP